MLTDDGSSKLVKFHWKSLQGKASFVWEEAQAVAGQNTDFMRQDLYDSIEAGQGPSWEVSIYGLEQFRMVGFLDLWLTLDLVWCANHGGRRRAQIWI